MEDNYYECMFLLDSGKYAADPDGVAGTVTGILEKSGATLEAHRPWQEGKLAYAIEGQRKALHYLALFRMDGTRLPEVTRACKLNDTVLRHMVIKHPKILFDRMVAVLNGEVPEEESPPAEEEGRGRTERRERRVHQPVEAEE